MFPSSGQFPEKSEPKRFREDGGCKTENNRNWKKGTTQSGGERLSGFRWGGGGRISSSSGRQCSHQLTAQALGTGHSRPWWLSGLSDQIQYQKRAVSACTLRLALLLTAAPGWLSVTSSTQYWAQGGQVLMCWTDAGHVEG